MQAQERIYLTRDGRAVRGDHPDQAMLLVGIGGLVPVDQAARLGIVEGRAPDPPRDPQLVEVASTEPPAPEPEPPAPEPEPPAPGAQA